MARKLSFEHAKAMYVHRYTMEHIPEWVRTSGPNANGKFYAPHFRSDREWYDNTLFYGESDLATKEHCYTAKPTWPLGQWLDAPYQKRRTEP